MVNEEIILFHCVWVQWPLLSTTINRHIRSTLNFYQGSKGSRVKEIPLKTPPENPPEWRKTQHHYLINTIFLSWIRLAGFFVLFKSWRGVVVLVVVVVRKAWNREKRTHITKKKHKQGKQMCVLPAISHIDYIFLFLYFMLFCFWTCFLLVRLFGASPFKYTRYQPSIPTTNWLLYCTWILWEREL